ncbi:RNAse P, Rpr2/Rpp21 subunit [Phaffia rhodozyma]|uniref:RNAse P, Rpr2/Rpp21 subunit n=1 Tax=Phaffia rhodozyma TaxID=264483 RepID=A0A0F7SSE4_PHARH|nr:RNAse P, Rpr2/Rpp21 subunit [Phaffia rhodozyma]
MAKSKPAATANVQPNVNQIPNKDLLLRLTYMHHAATYLHQASALLPPTADFFSEPRRSHKGKERALIELRPEDRAGELDGAQGNAGGEECLSRLARHIGRDIGSVARHNRAQLDPTFKRSICKTCHTVLLPGVTSRVKLKASSSHQKVRTEVCTHCSTTRSVPAPPVYSPSCETEFHSLPLSSESEEHSAPLVSSSLPARTLKRNRQERARHRALSKLAATAKTTDGSSGRRGEGVGRGRLDVPFSERLGVGHVLYEEGKETVSI